MPGRAASLQAGRKENRWLAGGRGSRVRPASGLDPDFFLDPGPSRAATSPRLTGQIWGKAVFILVYTGELEKGEFGDEGGGLQGSVLGTMAGCLDLKIPSGKALSGDTSLAIPLPGAGEGGGCGQGENLQDALLCSRPT